MNDKAMRRNRRSFQVGNESEPSRPRWEKKNLGGEFLGDAVSIHAFNAPLHPNPDDLRGEDEGLCQDAEEQVQVKAVLHQTPSARIPARAIGARSRELGNVSHTQTFTAAFPQLPFLTSSSFVFFFLVSLPPKL